MATPHQPQLNRELYQWLEARQSTFHIVKTTTTPSGQVLDWVPIETQHPGGKVPTPPPAVSLPARTTNEEKPVTAAKLELEDLSIERGPEGTVPIARPDFSKLTRMVKLSEYTSKRGGIAVNKRRPNKSPADPDPSGYFHAISSQWATVYGCDGFLSVWDPSIGPEGDHSIIQTWLQNYEKQTQSIEGGWTVDKSLNGDIIAHVFTFYTTNGYGPSGNDVGGYNRQYSGWKQYSSWCFPGIRINGASTQGGTQLGISIKYQLWQENWWFAVQGVWMGYYPASLFSGGIGNKAEWVGFGGEVYSSLANPEQTNDQMGSGRQAQDGWKEAAFQINLRNQTDLQGTMINHDGAAETDAATAGGSDPYNIQMHMNSGGGWGSYCYLGGPTK